MVFISYSWDSEEHIKKVSRLVKFLKRSGIQVIWDKELALGKRIPSFMEESLLKCGHVLFICTPNYKQKADERDGGVGYETNVITGDLYQSHNDIKYIPVLFEGDWSTSMPVWASGKLGADLRKESMQEYDKLLDALDGPEEVPAIPEKENTPETTQSPEEPVSPEEHRALKAIYQELLGVKEWLVGLELKTGGGMEDPDNSEDKIRNQLKNLQKMKNTYDFVLSENILSLLENFFRCWKVFDYRYTHFEEDSAREAAKNAEKKHGFLSALFSTSVNQMLRDSYENLKYKCNTVLSAIAQRMAQK